MSLIFSSMGVQKWRLLLSLHLIVQEEIKSNLAQQGIINYCGVFILFIFILLIDKDIEFWWLHVSNSYHRYYCGIFTCWLIAAIPKLFLSNLHLSEM